MSSIIDEIVNYDAIYRSDGHGYVNIHRHFLKKSEKTLNQKFRANTYLPLRILLYETRRSQVKHSLNDMWLLMHMSRKRNGDNIQPMPAASESDIIPWHQISAGITAPGPVSDLHFAPGSSDSFAFSTIDGTLYFGIVDALHLKIIGNLNIPEISFLKFRWVTKSFIVGIGFTSSIFGVLNDSRVYEIELHSTPSEIEIFNGNTNIAIVGDLSGNLFALDLEEYASSKNENMSFLQTTSTTITRLDLDLIKIYNTKKPITSVTSPSNSDFIICGTSEGDVFVLSIETKNVRKWRKQTIELKVTSVQKLDVNKFVRNLKPSTIDSLSAILISSKYYIFSNFRNETAILLCSDDNMKTFHLQKQYRIPSLRAKCPGSLSNVNGKWLMASGTDMGDLIINEEGEDIIILTMHESSITVAELVPNAHSFISADSSGLMSIWTKTDK